MKEEIKQKRDELIVSQSQFCQCKGTICHNCEPIIRQNLAIGFDYAWHIAQAEIEKLKSELKDYYLTQEKYKESYEYGLKLKTEIDELKAKLDFVESELYRLATYKTDKEVGEYGQSYLAQQARETLEKLRGEK